MCDVFESSEVQPLSPVAGGASPSAVALEERGLEKYVSSLFGAALDDRDTCLEACAALEAATVRSVATHRRLLRADGAEAVAGAMSSFLEDAEVQLVACQVLQHLASSSSADGAGHVARSGGCAAIVAALDAHRADPLVLQAACHALELVAFGGVAARTLVVADGAAEALVRVLKEASGQAHALQAALAALQALIERNPECTQKVADAGGIAAIVNVLGSSKNDRQIQYWGRLLLQGLCTENRSLRTEAVRKLHYQGVDMELV